MKYFEIIPLTTINKTLLYKFDKKLALGNIVEITIKKKSLLGIIIIERREKDINFDKNKILKIRSSLDIKFKSSHLDFIRYLSQHYFIDLGLAFKISIGSEVNIKKNIKNYLEFKSCIYETKKHLLEKNKLSNKQFNTLFNSNEIKEIENGFLFKKPNLPIKLNLEQQEIFTEIKKNVRNNYSCHLIDGVTGSGKTELYFQFILRALEQKKQILVMLPEIALTEDWSSRFNKYFGCNPYIWHSKQTANKKNRILRSLIKGEPCVVVGARSSVLLPFKNLSLIICDEEHDSSYKQDDGPKYNARDMAILKANKEKCLCLLVSASPSLETLYNVSLNKITHHKLLNQFSKTLLPKIILVDMNIHKPSHKSWISKEMFKATNKVLEKKGQVLFFLNRRGYAPIKICIECHTSLQCDNCATNLVYHKSINKLICHQCASNYNSNQICKKCSSSKFISLGIGLERLQEEVTRLFPGKKNQIFSSDTLKIKTNKKIFFENVFKNKTNILIGSQIIGKSFHFANLKLVNIIDGDSTLYSPDFRALEKTYQLFQQVAGRSGREGEQGSVIIQSYNINHSIFQSIKKQNRDEFLRSELKRRHLSKLPPYFKIGVISIIHKKQEQLREIKFEIVSSAKKLKLQIYGPTPALIPYKKNHYHEIFFFKELSYRSLERNISSLLSSINQQNQRFLNIDIDPINIS